MRVSSLTRTWQCVSVETPFVGQTAFSTCSLILPASPSMSFMRGSSIDSVVSSVTFTAACVLPRGSEARAASPTAEKSSIGHGRVALEPSQPAAAARPHARQLRWPPRWQPVLSPRSFAEHVASK